MVRLGIVQQLLHVEIRRIFRQETLHALLKGRQSLRIDTIGDIETDGIGFQVHGQADGVVRRYIRELHGIFQEFVGNVADRPFDLGLALAEAASSPG